MEQVIQAVRLQLYRDNLDGALELLGAAQAKHPDPRYETQIARIGSWRAHLASPGAYAAAYERYYRATKCRPGWTLLERQFRTLLGWRTRKIVRRTATHPEFRLLERELLPLAPRAVLDAGCGEGRVTLALAARHPALHVEGLEVTATNVAIARGLNRFPNATFSQGLIEEAGARFPAGAFDAAYAFAVLEHVADVDVVVRCLLGLVRAGGRIAFEVPMTELVATGALPDLEPRDGVAGHVRVFTAAELRERFGRYPGFVLERINGVWRAGRYPLTLAPVEFGSYFVAFTRP
ncbi:MAG: class I SAM-dependent methyltransferase [Candidatus Rokubacteria bacterium]|nr:class I SAM-dependent methyltransferase [Candidatus Rokubacteria bacterium]